MFGTFKFKGKDLSASFFNENKLAWKPVESVLAHVAAADSKASFGGRVTALVRFSDETFGVVRVVFNGAEWEAVPRCANDEGSLATAWKGIHPAEAEAMKIEDIQDFYAVTHDWTCQRCGSKDSDTADIVPTEVRIGVKLKFAAVLCGACSNALVSLVRPFLKEVPTDDQGPRSIIV